SWGRCSRIIPSTHYLLRAMVFRDIEEFMYSQLRRHHSLEYSSSPFSMAVKDVQGRKLLKPLVLGRDNHGKTNLAAEAESADLRVDLNRNLVLVRMQYGTFSMSNGDSGTFTDKTF